MNTASIGSLKVTNVVILFLLLFPLFVTVNDPPLSNVLEINNLEKKVRSLATHPSVSNELPIVNSQIESFTTGEQEIPFISEQNTSVNLTSKSLISINSSETSEIIVDSTPIYSSFIIHSAPSESNNSWINNIEPDYGEVEVSQNLAAVIPYYRLNFSENNVTPVSGITNIDFNVTAIPSPHNHLTEFSFGYRIPSIGPELMNETHSLVLELRFNNASLNFIISDKGSYFGDPIEENIYKPSSTSLYIFCNETNQFDWIIKYYNITHLITQYFLPSEYSMFSQLNTVFCYMFAFIPEFDISLDIKDINFTTSLAPNESAVTYTIAGSVIQSENGSIKQIFSGNNISIQVVENSPWQLHQLTKFFVVITRSLECFTRPRMTFWNNTIIQVNVNLSIPQLISPYLVNLLFITLPLDWILLDDFHSSISFETLETLEILSDNITGLLYRFSIQDLNSLSLQFDVPNYIQNIDAPIIISYYEIVQITGSLIQTSTGILHLYLMNQTVFHHDNTVCMVNGSFMFSMMSIDDNFPLGEINLVVNLSSLYQYGMYQQIVHIHSGEESTAQINLITPESIEIYQFDPIFLNLSLEKDGQKYAEEPAIVILVIGELIHQLSRSFNGFFSLMLNHVTWPPQQSNLSIIASNEEDFFASKILNITIYPVVVSWDIQGIPPELNPNTNLTLRVNMFITPQEGGTNWPLSEVDITIWINSTMINQYQTNLFGYVDVTITNSNYAVSNLLNLIIVSELENIILMMNTFTISISNDTIETGRFHPNLNEIVRAPIISNKSFFYMVNVTYPSNGSLWFISSDNYQGIPKSAYLLRNDFVLEIAITDQLIYCDLLSDPTQNDTIVLEFHGPIAIFSILEETSSVQLHIECYSNFTISDYSLFLDLDFIKFAVNKIILRDFLKRDISYKFDFELIDSYLYVKHLSLISGILANYYLEIQFEIPQIETMTEFKESYAYDEPIVGKWRFSCESEFSYAVSYTISNTHKSECQNTTLYPLTNNTYIVEAFFQKFKWNSSVIVALKLNFSNGALSTSADQMFTIIDPYPPDYSYYLEPHERTINLHIITSEPDTGSGIRNITCTYLGFKYNSTVLSPNHHFIEFPLGESQFGVIDIIISDWAGNENSFSIDLMSEMGSPNVRESYDPSIFFPSLFSLMVISGIIAIKFVRKRQNSIL